MRGGPLGALLTRFGASVTATEAVGPSSSGARTLLAAAERSGESAIHGVRGLLWILFLVGFTSWSGIPAFAAAAVGVFLGAIWLAFLALLQGARSFNPTRYGLVILDGLLVLRAVAASEGASEATFLAQLFGAAPPPPDVQAYVPPLLVFIALSAALRIDLRAAVVVTIIALSTYAYAAVTLRVAPDEALFVGGVIFLAGVVGTNATRVVRQVVLRAQEQAVLEAFLPEHMSRDMTVAGGLERSGRLEEVTLLTCDVRGFTKMSEQLTPVDTVAFVNMYLEAVCPAIVGSGGVIDKFMGDGVLAFFEGGGHAGRALNAARGIVAAAARVKTRSGDPIKVGVAVHSGVVLVGTIGPRSRREYTIISDTVNTLSRLEELNKHFQSVITASDKTLSEVAPEQRHGFTGPETIPVRGRAEPVVVYYLRPPASAEAAVAQAVAAAPKPPAAPEPAAAPAQPQVQYWKD
jgi:class 3 adenylate cyclase